ncbi:major facilitator superfamily transporter [Colletotrichum musicola]|uniref:Major facilitator superfamily transporter n=1 Tax=Colletotrichum musicola TaxID=2175873 RepID=A0A8H6K2T4_9PEZI|nr:major facilitator superfamily transporter [Colletotrichum musicola]
MPRKDQLLILFLVRFSEPVVKASIATYLYYQLKSLDASLSSAEVIRQSAFLQTAFIISQCISSLFLGKLSDSRRGGRKLVLLIGMTGSFVSCVLFGFIRHYYQAVILYTLEGAFNGNVATVRTMLSEVAREKRTLDSFQARAIVLMPIAFNVAVLVSPVMAGQLADLRGRYPDWFSDSRFLERYPYAPPALANGVILLTASLTVFLFLEEGADVIDFGKTSKIVERRHDTGIALGRKIKMFFCSCNTRGARYQALDPNGSPPMSEVEELPLMVEDETDPESPAQTPKGTEAPQPARKRTAILPLKRILTKNLCLVLMAAAVQDGHIAVYNALWPNFLSDPVVDDAHATSPEQRRRLPFRFSGGAGMAPSDIAWSLALLGLLGLPTQLLAYPRVAQRLGALRTLRLFARFWPLVYAVVPYIAVVPSTAPPPAGKRGAAVWALIVVSQALMVGCSTFTAPSQLVLINLGCSASPHPSALARTNSLSFLVTAVVRAVASATSAWVYSWGSSHALTGLAWWLAGVASAVGFGLSLMCKEGNGHEIWLSGDEE